MDSLLINIAELNKHQSLLNLEQQIGKIDVGGGDIGLILVVSKKELDNMKSLNGNEKSNYFNSKSFLNSITNHAYVILKNNKVKLQPDCKNMISYVLDSCLRYLPNDMTLVVKTDDNDYINELEANMFVAGKLTKCGLVKLKRPNSVFFDNQESNNPTINNHVTSTAINGICNYNFKLSQTVLEYLKKLPYAGVTKNKETGVVSQKEFCGHLVTGAISDDKDMVHDLVLPTQGVTFGGGESVSCEIKLVTYHSHPEEAYLNHNVELGCPSLQDYLTFLNAASKVVVIMTIVVTKEGLYILSIPKGNIESETHKFDKDEIKTVIEDSGYCDKSKCKNAKDHALKMSNLKYKNVFLVDVKFFDWEEKYEKISLFHRGNAKGECEIPK